MDLNYSDYLCNINQSREYSAENPDLLLPGGTDPIID